MTKIGQQLPYAVGVTEGEEALECSPSVNESHKAHRLEAALVRNPYRCYCTTEAKCPMHLSLSYLAEPRH